MKKNKIKIGVKPAGFEYPHYLYATNTPNDTTIFIYSYIHTVCPFVRLSVNNFYSLDLPYYLEESTKTWHSERIYIAVVHLDIGFYRAAKNVPVGLDRKSRFFK